MERNHVLVRVSVVGGPSERKLPPRALQEVGHALAVHPNLVQSVFGKSSQLRSLLPSQFFNMQDICVLFTVCRILKCGRYLLKCSSLKRYHHYRRTPLVKCPFFICRIVWGRQTLVTSQLVASLYSAASWTFALWLLLITLFVCAFVWTEGKNFYKIYIFDFQTSLCKSSNPHLSLCCW